MTFVDFDLAYVERLRQGDPETEAHFTRYFGELLQLKLRRKLRSAQLVEDTRQETLLRVIRVVRGKGIEHPERLGAFVHSVCNNVMLEQIRQDSRHLPMQESAPDPPDERVNPDAGIEHLQMKHLVEGILDALPAKDCSILRLIFISEVPKEQVCRQLNVDPDYLRVLLHRAKSRFRAEYQRRHNQQTSETPAEAATARRGGG
jgi:RNA polymerase sigma-70 factor (ECF subfamily)